MWEGMKTEFGEEPRALTSELKAGGEREREGKSRGGQVRTSHRVFGNL